jgi:hypothetical protein
MRETIRLQREAEQRLEHHIEKLTSKVAKLELERTSLKREVKMLRELQGLGGSS